MLLYQPYFQVVGWLISYQTFPDDYGSVSVILLSTVEYIVELLIFQPIRSTTVCRQHEEADTDIAVDRLHPRAWMADFERFTAQKYVCVFV